MPDSPATRDPRIALALQHAIRHRDRRMVVILNPEAHANLTEIGAAPKQARLCTIEMLDAAPPTERFDLAIVAEDALKEPETHEAGGILGRLRDRWAQETLVVSDPRHARWQLTDLIAHGFERTTTPESIGFDARPAVIYRVSLNDYKRTPDWLNARFWAHPERWGQSF